MHWYPENCRRNANGVIIAHNHPSGNLKPSSNDEELTNRIKQGLEIFDITLLDHIIFTESESEYFSFADKGIL